MTSQLDVVKWKMKILKMTWWDLFFEGCPNCPSYVGPWDTFSNIGKYLFPHERVLLKDYTYKDIMPKADEQIVFIME